MPNVVCISCGWSFSLRPQSPRQKYCSKAECQRERRRLWAKEKLRSDPDYRANQLAAQRAWHARNPDYWKAYRSRNEEPPTRDRASEQSATSDASIFGIDAASGLCWIEIYTRTQGVATRTWRIELSLRSRTALQP